MIWAFNLKSHLMLCLLDKCSWWMSTTSNVWYVPTSRSLNSLHNMEIASPKLHVSPLEIIPLQSSSFFNKQRGSFWAFQSFCSSKSEREIHTRDVWSSPFVALRSTFTSLFAAPLAEKEILGSLFWSAFIHENSLTPSVPPVDDDVRTTSVNPRTTTTTNQHSGRNPFSS